MIDRIHSRNARLAVIGLGYVGLPLAVEFGKHFQVVGFDVNARRLEELRRGHDRTLEVAEAELRLAVNKQADIFIVTVPTPIDAYNRPDLSP